MALNLGEMTVFLRANLTNMTRNLNRATLQIRTFSAKMQASLSANAAQWQMLGRRAMIAGAAMAGAVVLMTKKFGNFDLAMRKATTATETTQEEFEQLADVVEENATRINIAAIDAAEGIKFLGFAGLDATQQMKAFVPLLELSKVGMADMGTVTERLLGVMGAFQIEFDKTGEVADKVAKIWGSSQQTLEDLSNAFSLSAAGAAEMGLSIGELGALTALMAKAHIKGTRAGTTLRRTFLNLKAPTSELRKLLRDLNIQTEDANGEFRNGIDVLEDLLKATENMGATARATAFKVAFGARAVEGMTVVANKGIPSLRKYADSIENADGTIKIMLERRMKSFNEQWGITIRLIGEASRAVGEVMAPEFAKFNLFLRDSVKGLRDWIKEHQRATKFISATTFALGSMLFFGGLSITMLGSLAFTATALGISMGALAIKMALVTGGLTLIAGALTAATLKHFQLKAETQKTTKIIEASRKSVESYKKEWEDLADTLSTVAKGQELIFKRLELEIDIKKVTSKLEQLDDFIKNQGFVKRTFMKIFFGEKREEILANIDALKTKLNELGTEFGEVTEEAKKMADDISGALEKTKNDVDSTTNFMKQAFEATGEAIGDSMVDNLADASQGLKTFEQAFIDVLTNIQNELVRFASRQLLRKIFSVLAPGSEGVLFPTGGGGEQAPTTEFAKGGIVKPVYAARGFVSKGTDKVPAMLTAGEAVIPKGVTDFFRRTGMQSTQQPPTIINFNISAIDQQGVARFLETNQKQIASSVQSASRANHPIRRGSSRGRR